MPSLPRTVADQRCGMFGLGSSSRAEARCRRCGLWGIRTSTVIRLS
ncbi:hypothetical protein SO694_0008703 [Aureococcus anophagefferens]|uniref:Uncharacterized protein n=1 Tax=Aureococcus anophagefferens TaxID=44056 RepID=A0ABR1G4R7_AURAN